MIGAGLAGAGMNRELGGGPVVRQAEFLPKGRAGGHLLLEQA